MRVTNSMLTRQVINNLTAAGDRTQNLQNQLSSGKRISKPSDDPVDAALALGQRTRLARIEQLERNNDAATDFLTMAGNLLEQVTSTITRVHEISIQASNETLGPSERTQIGDELKLLMEHSVTLVNGSSIGRHVFAGSKVDVQPFTLTLGSPTTLVYNGDTTPLNMHIDEGVDMPVNVTGDRLSSAIQAMIDVYDVVKTGTAPTTAQMNALDTALVTITSIQAEVGAKVNRLESIALRSGEDKVQIQALLSKTEEADIVEVAINLKSQQNVYEAALSVGSRVIQSSLIQFLR